MNIKDVENLAALARIELSEEEKLSLLKDFDSILAYVRQIESIKLDDINPEEKVSEGHHNSWREDRETERDFSPELILAQFPDSQGRFLKVKKIL